MGRSARFAKLFLVVLLFGVAGWIAWTRLAPLRRPAPPPPPPPPFPDSIAWPDGSLNVQLGLEESRRSPAELAALLAEAPPAKEVPRDAGRAPIMVFPFRDLTTDGMGDLVVLSWHPTASTALALWTNASVLSPEALWSVATPRWDEIPAKAPETAATWASRVRAQSCVPPEAVVISGVYRDGDTTATPVVEIFWLKPGESEPRPILTEAAGNPTALGGPLEAQRRQVRAVADFAVKEGLATANKGAGTRPGADYDAELRRIVVAANGRHSWLMQEAANRALLLARQYPDESLPLQAAAYAQTAGRSWIYPFWESARQEDYRAILRVIGTAQVAAQNASQAEAPRALLWFNLRDIGVDSPGVSNTPGPGAWDQIGSFATEEMKQFYVPDIAILPDWFGARMCALNLWYFGTSGLEEWRNAIAARRPEVDVMSAMAGDSLGSMDRGDTFGVQVKAAEDAWREDALNFLALAVTLMANQEADRAEKLLAGLPGSDAGLTDQAMAAAPEGFFAVRQAMLPLLAAWKEAAAKERGRWTAWDTRGSVYHRLLRACGELRQNPPKALAEAAPAGFEGVAYSPTLRWHEYGTRLELGITQYLRFIRDYFGSEDMWRMLLAEMGGAMPVDGSPFWVQRARYAAADGRKGKAVERAREYLREVSGAAPWDWKALLELGAFEIREGDSMSGFAMMKECERLARYDPEISLELAEFYERANYKALAVKHYGRYLAQRQKAYDVIGTYLRLRRELGDTTNVVAQLTQCADAVPGNGRVVDNLLNYQTYVLKDYSGAKASLERYARFRSVSSAWQLAIPLAAGDTTECLRLLARSSGPPAGNAVSTIGYHITRARYFRQLDRLAEAEGELSRAQQLDSARGTVMWEAVEMAWARKNYPKALELTKAIEARYQPSGDTTRYIAEALCQMDRKPEAIETLAQYLRQNPRDTRPVAKLIRYLGEQGRKAEAAEMFEWALASPCLTSNEFDDCVYNYSSIDSARAAAVKARRGEYVGGPTTVEEALALAGARRGAPRPSLLAN